jgi:hypothetical protein
MTSGWLGGGMRWRSRDAAGIAACLMLAACTGPPAQMRWVKAGVDDKTAAHEIDDCRGRATEAQSTQLGIDQDRSATLGRNWALSNTTGLQNQTMRQQAAGLADQAFNNCMRAKGFTKSG